jgi:glycosyltransferase involved in cell wall biosynthesis
MNNLVIILPVYNRIEITRRFVECLKSQTFQDFEVWLFDDGNDGTDEMVLYNLPTNKCRIYVGDNLYWGGSLRKAFELLQDYQDNPNIMLANDDLIFGKCYLEYANLVLRDNMLLSTIVYQDKEIIDGGISVDWKNYKFKVGTPIDCASTRGLFLTLNTWKKIGNINRLLPMHGDYDFTLRAVKKGVEIKTHKFVYAISTDIPEKEKRRSSVFSVLHYMNPFHHTITLINHCPLKYLPLNLLRVWGSALWKTVKRDRKSVV